MLTIEERARISRLQGDLRWLVTEGYVTEFIDGRLFAPPPMVEARKKEVEAEEIDPENFPEVPASNPPFQDAPAPAGPDKPAEAAEAPAPEAAAPEMPAADTAAAVPAPAAEPAVAPETPGPAAVQPAPEAADENPPVADGEAALAANPSGEKAEATPGEAPPA